MPAYLVASSVIAVQAQRLVRRLCDCKTREPGRHRAPPKGCEACRLLRLHGRIGHLRADAGDAARAQRAPRPRRPTTSCGAPPRPPACARCSRTGCARSRAASPSAEELLRVVPPDEVDDRRGRDGSGAGAPPPRHACRRPSAAARAGAPLAHPGGDDDEAPPRRAAAETLDAENYEVVTRAHRERGADQRLSPGPPDLILTDLQMPEHDGLELLRKLRGDLSTCQIPVIFLTVRRRPRLGGAGPEPGRRRLHHQADRARTPAEPHPPVAVPEPVSA